MNLPKISKPILLFIICIIISACSSSENTEQSEDLNILQNYEVKVPTTPLDAPSEYSKNLTPIWETWAYLVRDYVNRSDLNEDEMTELVIKAMMKSLGDQHSNYISPEFFNVENTDMQGKYQGIGASVTMNANGNVVIVSPFEGSPAKKAGIRPGDIILEVNGKSLEGYSLMEAINIIRGPEGTSVELLVKHLLSKDTELITIVRSSIKLDSVLLRSKPKSKIAHIRVTNFYPETAEDLSNMINKSKKEGAEAVLLDLRNNPGGLLSSVIDVTSLFLDDGVVIKEIDGYAREQIWKVKKSGPKYIAIPLVLLINNYSASASEVLAGALKDYKRAKIVGETSFGKGSVGILRPLSNGGGISVTIAKWYTPNNNLIDNKGIVPDIEIKSSDPSDTSGVQTEATLEYINNNILNK